MAVQVNIFSLLCMWFLAAGIHTAASQGMEAEEEDELCHVPTDIDYEELSSLEDSALYVYNHVSISSPNCSGIVDSVRLLYKKTHCYSCECYKTVATLLILDDSDTSDDSLVVRARIPFSVSTACTCPDKETEQGYCYAERALPCSLGLHAREGDLDFKFALHVHSGNYLRGLMKRQGVEAYGFINTYQEHFDVNNVISQNNSETIKMVAIKFSVQVADTGTTPKQTETDPGMPPSPTTQSESGPEVSTGQPRSVPASVPSQGVGLAVLGTAVVLLLLLSTALAVLLVVQTCKLREAKRNRSVSEPHRYHRVHMGDTAPRPPGPTITPLLHEYATLSTIQRRAVNGTSNTNTYDDVAREELVDSQSESRTVDNPLYS